MTNLTSLSPVPGSQKKRVRRARGRASGLGGTAGRGMNGQNSRTGRKRYATFEWGQTPLFRRIPKLRGFTAFEPKEYISINLYTLEKLGALGVTTIDYAVLYERRIIREKGKLLKILGAGKLTHALTILADSYSASAKATIEKAGGQANV